MNKIMAFLPAMLLIVLTACADSTVRNAPVETTTAVVQAETMEPAEVATEAAEVMVAPAAVYEEYMDKVSYCVPNGWRKVDYSNDSLKEYIYYPDETNQNCVMTMMLYADNTIYTRQQAEEYMDVFMDGFFSAQNGYSEGTFSSHAAVVPARHGYYGNGGMEVEAYCYLPTTTSIFILSKWHLPESSSEIADDEFLEVVNSVRMPKLNVEEEPGGDTGNQYTSEFTNQYGTNTTKCAYPGCDRNIASSGDTNCCSNHSNKCGNCGCYIDSDAMYCMSCLAGSLGGSSNSYDYDKGYGYSAPKEGQSFSDYVKEQDPELYDSITNNYNSAVGKSGNSSKDSYDYDKGYGYSAPKKGQSFSDYVKEQDPELYDSLFK